MRGTGLEVGLTMLCVVVAASCDRGGADRPGPPDFRDATPDPGVLDAPSETGVEAMGEPAPDVFDDDAAGVEDTHATDLPDTTDPGLPATFCAPQEACNAPLHADGTCPGSCIPQAHAMTCGGQVFHALCHMVPPPAWTNNPAQFGALLVTPETWPDQAAVGESHPVQVTVRNLGATPLALPFSFKHPDTWEVVSADFAGLSSLVLAPAESRTLHAVMRAVRPDVLDPYGGVLLTLAFGDDIFDLHSVVAFGPDEPIECGGFFFPAQWCPDGACMDLGHFYLSARCCGEVFYPGAQCCGDEDCDGGSCVDGRCLTEVPSMGLANTLPLGHQHILMVLVDSDFPPAPSPCLDRGDEVRQDIPFDQATDFLEELVFQRTLRDLVDFRWTVLAGLVSEDFINDGNYLFPNYLDRLNDHLATHGCAAFDQYDKVIVASPRMDLLGWGGQAMDRGRIAAFTAANPYLLAHEIAHTFGASDLYLDLGGMFQYQLDLMANNLGGFGPPRDGVMWGEMGLDDVDRDGVVDLMEFAAFPESLEVASLTATLTHKESLEIAIAFGGREAGTLRRVVLPGFHLELPGLGVARDVLDSRRVKVLAFDGTEVDLPTLRTWEVLEIRVVASLSYTTKDWDRRTVAMDQTITVPLEKPPPAE